MGLRVTIGSVDSQTLLVKARDGTMTSVKLADGAQIFTLTKGSVADVSKDEARLVPLIRDTNIDPSTITASIQEAHTMIAGIQKTKKSKKSSGRVGATRQEGRADPPRRPRAD